MPNTQTKPDATKVALPEAAKRVLPENGHPGLSTCAIAAAANTQMSQIHNHFG